MQRKPTSQGKFSFQPVNIESHFIAPGAHDTGSTY